MARLLRRTLSAGAGPILAGAALAVLALVAVFLLLTREGRAAARARSEDELARSYAVQSRLLNERLARQEIGARALAAMVGQATASAGEDPLPRWFAGEYDFAAVLSPDGQVLAGGDLLPGEPATLASRFRSRSGLLAHDVALYVIAGLEVAGGEPGRLALVGERLDAPFAREVGDAISVDLAYVLDHPSGPVVAASTLSRSDADELSRSLRRLGDWNRRIAQASRTRLELGGRSFAAMLSPLRSDEQVVGAVVTMAATDSLPALTRKARSAALLIGLLGVVAGSLVALLGVRRQLRPILALPAILEQTALEGTVPKASGPVGSSLSAVAAAVRARLDSEQARAALGARAREAIAGRLATGHGTRLVAGPGVILALDLRRFAPAAAARHPDLALARYGADRDHVARAMAARGGELVAVAGHRLLGVFPCEAAAEALLAAVEIGALLRHGDSVFDDPVPPAIALAEGDLVRGRIGEGLRAQRAVLGRAVQETDALLREAMAGDVLFSGALRERLREPLAAAGVTVTEQRAVLFPKAIHRVDLAAALAVLGSELTSPAPPLATGVVLVDRFEVEHPLDETAEGRRYAAHDRHTGGSAEILVLGDEADEEAGGDGRGSAAAVVPLERVVDLIERSRGLPPPVVPLLDGGLVGERVFLASSAVAGASLEQVVAAGGPLAPAPALELGLQLARGLAAVHRAGLTDGGLRPERAILGADGSLRLPWVGVGCLVAEGTPRWRDDPFLAPEERSGGRRSGGQPVAPATDLYAWAALLHFALLGEPRADAVERWRPEPARLRSIPGLSAGLAQAIERCLADDPAARPADGAALVDSIGPFVAGASGA